LFGAEAGGREFGDCVAPLPQKRVVMPTACSYDDDADRNLHSRAIRRLAGDFGCSEEEVQVLYETLLCSLRENARVKDYLVILVTRYVKEMIRRGRNPQTS
jgi:Protein of unknown function (DUF3562)